MLSKQCQEEQHTAQKALWLIFSSVRYLARQGLSLRGDDHKDGNLYQLLKERSVDVPEMAIWLQRRDNWTSDKIQNEILEMFAHTIHRSIMSDLQNVEFYSITADGTTDISGQEQFSVTLRYVQPDLTYRNMFLGFYNCPDSTGESLFKAICDIFLRLNLPMERIQGYCFDGASNMSGMVKGVQARLQERCPHSVYIHCTNHSLDLALQEVAREVQIVASALQFIKDASSVIRESLKRKGLYESMFGEGETT